MPPTANWTFLGCGQNKTFEDASLWASENTDRYFSQVFDILLTKQWIALCWRSWKHQKVDIQGALCSFGKEISAEKDFYWLILCTINKQSHFAKTEK